MKGFQSCDFVALQVGSVVNIPYSTGVEVIIVYVLIFLFLAVFVLFLLVVLKLKGLQCNDVIPWKCVKRKASKSSTEVRVAKVVLTLSPQESIQLLKTDFLKQKTGVEVLCDDRLRGKVRKNISIRGTLPQVRRSLQIIDETLDNTSADVLNQETCSPPQTSLTSQAICTQVERD
ncbi:uncharacterized protein LOC112576008 [Pomacea canaliculata]|uniref:uncharacterized protein LOC112576008 n=1 Tax=Pomacea canaliculata TaxID=400727 RepID=UPI000D72A0E6|nr:uncharacterized protein LOC112576008 [Pomacea canaliculata]